MVCLFKSIVVNKPETLLESEFTRRGRIEHHFAHSTLWASFLSSISSTGSSWATLTAFDRLDISHQIDNPWMREETSVH
ncbi:hypothetical protein N7519_010452 [Penicillium mononematosum]|uniref:uncharacterized protein n=1 Tax=Penicillium mononematosum TaxID=268346 RepID=UPI002546AE82|nr:uncharacterized protein N7519_010452 [Penicillium mononematosum]KAJ6179991.1 hypothetical protein N7519_010452 [Penicillium mononematosum]